MTATSAARQRTMFKRRAASLKQGGQPPPESLEEGQVGAVDSGSITADAALRKRFRDPLGWIIIALLMGWRPMELLPLPSWFGKAALTAGILVSWYRFMTFTRWSDEMKHVRKFVAVTALAILELLIENYFVWVVAASNNRKYDLTDIPLQDNIAIFFRNWMKTNSVVKWLVMWRWCSIANMVMVFVCMSVAYVWDQIPYSGFAVASRALLMHCIVRVIRTVGFLSVVMPHPKHPNCYAGKFPPVPDKMLDYIMTGLSSLKGGGGCNDLIISGHACTWMMAVTSVWTYYPHSIAKYLLVLAYIQTGLRTAVEGWHYSVDFILPPALCWFIWRDLDWICPLDEVFPVRSPGSKPDPVNKIAVFGAFLGITFGVVNAFFVGA